MASRIQIPLAWLTSRLQARKDRDKMTRFFLFFSLFPNAVGVLCHSSLSFIIHRCHNRFRCHPAIIIIVIVFVVVASKEKNALQKRKFVDFQKSGRGSSRGLFVDNMYRTIIINKTKNKMKRLGRLGTGTGQRTTSVGKVGRYAGPVDRDGTSKVGTYMSGRGGNVGSFGIWFVVNNFSGFLE